MINQEIYSFIKSPSLKIEKSVSINDKIISFRDSILFLFFFTIASVVLIKIIDSIVFYCCNFSIFETITKHNDNYYIEKNFWFNCFYVVLLGPFIEEIIFRLPLNLNKWNVAAGISTYCFLFFGDKIQKMSMYNFNTWVKLGIVCFVFMVFYFLKQKYFDYIENKFFGYYFYALSLSFGLMHIFNFTHLVPNKLIILLPFFVLPQIGLGFFAGYIRIKNGFLWGLLIHICFNAPNTLLHILTTY